VVAVLGFEEGTTRLVPAAVAGLRLPEVLTHGWLRRSPPSDRLETTGGNALPEAGVLVVGPRVETPPGGRAVAVLRFG
jgi:hypothetical protein